MMLQGWRRMGLSGLLVGARPFSKYTKVYVNHLPTYWDEKEIKDRFGIVGEIKSVRLIKNSLGENSGKALIDYNNNKTAMAAIEKFHDRAVENLIATVVPFLKKGEVAPRNEPEVLAKRVQLMNLPFDCYDWEVKNLCKTFVPIQKVVMVRNNQGLATGFAFVFVEKASDMQTLIDYVDGRHIRGR
mmetsp:Transcript_1777/g.2314  ORF Transcript_1777/g.2314 Transcript_1777/m.2314 type:complete len:186 (-) Transcript_1777:103-660(-)